MIPVNMIDQPLLLQTLHPGVDARRALRVHTFNPCLNHWQTRSPDGA
jgi:hypothetical protein